MTPGAQETHEMPTRLILPRVFAPAVPDEQATALDDVEFSYGDALGKQDVSELKTEWPEPLHERQHAVLGPVALGEQEGTCDECCSGASGHHLPHLPRQIAHEDDGLEHAGLVVVVLKMPQDLTLHAAGEFPGANPFAHFIHVPLPLGGHGIHGVDDALDAGHDEAEAARPRDLHQHREGPLLGAAGADVAVADAHHGGDDEVEAGDILGHPRAAATRDVVLDAELVHLAGADGEPKAREDVRHQHQLAQQHQQIAQRRRGHLLGAPQHFELGTAEGALELHQPQQPHQLHEADREVSTVPGVQHDDAVGGEARDEVRREPRGQIVPGDVAPLKAVPVLELQGRVELDDDVEHERHVDNEVCREKEWRERQVEGQLRRHHDE
eukprot:scaffold111_cov252-Pinguiococcus_pyrenoidosus.AAC.16